ncbi:CBS domain-containing protein [Persicobacter sp. CCB-QB2]|uniref:CBS domain-containing protein n=1 Tax=Persicobacter sp. CCB-QB2 TaxID=1561025 RepID=UPI0006A9E988|nr:CBS domain-containing protein [Persicobacter sp. CCB-QB2]
MIAESLINHSIPPLKSSDNSQKALLWMEELRMHQLPVVDNRKFKGMISEELVLENNNIDALVGEYDLIAEQCYVQKHQHMLDVIKLSTDYGVDIVAVVDEDLNFQGIITLNDTLKALSQLSAIQSPGGILILSMKQIDYSLAEITRLIEENNTKILSTYVYDDPEDPTRLHLTVKLNTHDLQRIVATLERFGYLIEARFEETTSLTNEQERFDILMKYLNI